MAASRGYSVPEVGQNLEAARDIAASMNDINSLFSILRGSCNFTIVAADMGAAGTIARECMAIADKTGLPEHRIEACLPLGWVEFALGRFDEAYRLLKQSIAIYDECAGLDLSFPTPQDPKTASLSALLQVVMALGYEEEEAEVSNQLLGHLQHIDSSFDSVFGYIFLAWHALDRQRYELCLDYATRALDLCDLHGYSYHGLGARLYQAVATSHLDRSRISDVIGQAESGINGLLKLEANHALPHRMSALSSVYALAGEHDRASRLNQQALDLARKVNDNFAVPLILFRQWDISRQMNPEDQAGCDVLLQAAFEAADGMSAPGYRAMMSRRLSGHLDLVSRP